MRALILASILSPMLIPTAALACSCEIPPSELAQALRKGQAQAVSIYRGHVSTADAKSARIEVLEVFKGPVTRGQVVELPVGDGRNCTYVFRPDGDYLIYSAQDRVSACSRTRAVGQADIELDWLRTGRMPAAAKGLRRESVTCEPCSLLDITMRLAPLLDGGDEPAALFAADDIRAALAVKRAFFAKGPRTADRSHSEIGVDAQGNGFELTETGGILTSEPCRARVLKRSCESVELSKKDDLQGGLVRCIKPGQELEYCDSNVSRETSWGPVEPTTVAHCEWQDPYRTKCELEGQKTSRATGSPKGPQLYCAASKTPYEFRCEYVPVGDGGVVRPPTIERIGTSDWHGLLTGHIKELKRCNEASRRDQPKEGGTIVIRFEVGPDGTVERATPQTPEFRESPFAKCVAKAAAGWRLSPHRVATPPFELRFKFGAPQPGDADDDFDTDCKF